MKIGKIVQFSHVVFSIQFNILKYTSNAYICMHFETSSPCDGDVCLKTNEHSSAPNKISYVQISRQFRR